MATTTTRVYFSKARFSLNKEDVTVPSGGTVSISEAPAASANGLGEDALLLEATLPTGAELALVLRSSNKMFTGPNGEFVYPEVAKLSYAPDGPAAAQGLTKVSPGGAIAQTVTAPHTINVATYAPKCG